MEGRKILLVTVLMPLTLAYPNSTEDVGQNRSALRGSVQVSSGMTLRMENVSVIGFAGAADAEQQEFPHQPKHTWAKELGTQRPGVLVHDDEAGIRWCRGPEDKVHAPGTTRPNGECGYVGKYEVMLKTSETQCHNACLQRAWCVGYVWVKDDWLSEPDFAKDTCQLVSKLLERLTGVQGVYSSAVRQDLPRGPFVTFHATSAQYPGQRWCRGPGGPAGTTAEGGECGYKGPYQHVVTDSVHRCKEECNARSWCVGFAYKHTADWKDEPDFKVGSCQLVSMLRAKPTGVSNIDSWATRDTPCKCQAKRRNLEDDIAKDMAEMVKRVRNSRFDSFSNWRNWFKDSFPSTTSGFFKGDDRMALWKRDSDNTCVLVMSASDDRHDWADDVKFKTRDKCGNKLHRGFVNELEEYKGRWGKTIEPLLKSAHCSCIVVAGHSLGGALASVVTQCSISGDLPFEVNALHTYGAPKVSTRQISRSGDKCIWGLRFVAFRNSTGPDPYDFVTSLPPLPGWDHPKMRTIILDKEKKERRSTPCGETHKWTVHRPYVLASSFFLLNEWPNYEVPIREIYG